MTYKEFGARPWLMPQPVLIIGTFDEKGNPNAMNAAWGGTWDMKEIVISLAKHATTDNMDLTGEFTVAFATKETLVAADFVGLVSKRKDPDKFLKTGWSYEKAPHVNAPLIKDFPMTLECRIKSKLDESETGFYLIAEIVNVLVDDRYLSEDGKPAVEKMHLISFDPTANHYIEIGNVAGDAFSAGKALK